MLARVIDPDYTGNVGVVLHNLSYDTKFTQQVGQPIGQLILEVASIFPTLEVGGLPITARGPMVLAVKISPEELLEDFDNTVLTQNQNVCITNLSRIYEYYIDIHI